ncbi:MAG TPA: class I SAM-dependent methyltransferase [Bryobacteraceae bacterium]|nr:class I SAM-dependent methyltransferase [Bryobacteraceae bacterium]
MENLFGAPGVPAGYAAYRPAVHPCVMEKVYKALDRPGPFCRALDVGCGAGVSTKALENFASHCVGIEPVESMLRWTRTVAPRADFIVGCAEAIPAGDGSIDLMTAAGSLNYVDLKSFFCEAARVLSPAGVLVVYDFLPGRRFREGAELEDWFLNFKSQYPPPRQHARPLDPTILAELNLGFRVRSHEHFEIGIRMTPEFYLEYMMTETNVAAALRDGASDSDIRSWCAKSLAPVWDGGPREVLFEGYFACMTAG